MKNTQRLSLGALLLAVMLVLGYLESLIPLTGMPGVKPGLSNCVLMFSLEWLGGGMTLRRSWPARCCSAAFSSAVPFPCCTRWPEAFAAWRRCCAFGGFPASA